jgi:hypothetical protein
MSNPLLRKSIYINIYLIDESLATNGQDGDILIDAESDVTIDATKALTWRRLGEGNLNTCTIISLHQLDTTVETLTRDLTAASVIDAITHRLKSIGVDISFEDLNLAITKLLANIAMELFTNHGRWQYQHSELYFAEMQARELAGNNPVAKFQQERLRELFTH